ncbi:hypothetical protein GCK72_011170 [Caenorhabditis remanei]|uniref:Uncharacterized protein n=1 Tax=Caenorhabditis remanei TaxID=31234 RepID=A0A6A5H7R5_CAERE|nr:hypothetical protein GCK72_011170 [Caenorhabditis remanei]KAF1762906.1 hypothetical protein GCK72_011170 [Caenorhabditis remanei]
MSSIVNTPREKTGLLETSHENIIQKVVGEILETVEIMERLLSDVESSLDAPDVVEMVVEAPEASPNVVNVINASETVAEPPIENPAEDIEILDVQSPESSTVVTIHFNHSPEVINVSVVVTGSSDDSSEVVAENSSDVSNSSNPVDETSDENHQAEVGNNALREMTNLFNVSGASSKKLDSGPPAKKQKIDMPLQTSTSEDSDSDDSTQNAMAPTSSTLSEALLRITDSAMPPSMLKHRDDGVYKHCLVIGKKIQEEHSEEQIEMLIQNPRQRTALYRRYYENGWLHEPSKSRMEQLPIYAALMASLTKSAFMDGLQRDKMCTGNDIHVKIFEASRIKDAEVAELVRQYTSGQKTAKMFGMDIWAILNNYENVMGVKKVATLGDVPDGAYLVCYGELPDFPSIQSKHLTCLIVNPSNQSIRLICHLDHFVNGVIAGAACGRSQANFPCMWFGPTVKQPSGDMKTAIKLSAAFSAVTDGKRDVKDIYGVDGYI